MSSSGPVYLLDANMLIQAYRLYYDFDLVPRFWTELAKNAQNGHIKSIDRVLDEINTRDDDLKKWVDRFEAWFLNTEYGDVLDAYASVISWALKENYKERAKNDFAQADNADAWVVAYAKARDCIVVTEGYFNVDIKKKIPVPSVCRNFDVRCLNTFDMMRELGIAIK